MQRVVVAIPHFFDRHSVGEARHDSGRADSAAKRAAALSYVIYKLHELFNQPYLIAQHSKQNVVEHSAADKMQVDIYVVTNGDNHLIDQLSCSSRLYNHVPAEGDPRWLGLAAHKVLAMTLGRYDWYCYLEDDIAIEDPFFFHKLRYAYDLLDAQVGADTILQPMRVESLWDAANPALPTPRKLYPDWESRPPTFEGPLVHIDMLGRRWTLEPARHPHAGAFFLDQVRSTQFVNSKYCGEVVEIWVTPPYTTATWNVMQVFRPYKPAVDSLAFLEIRHLRPAMITALRQETEGVDNGAYTWRKSRNLRCPDRGPLLCPAQH